MDGRRAVPLTMTPVAFLASQPYCTYIHTRELGSCVYVCVSVDPGFNYCMSSMCMCVCGYCSVVTLSLSLSAYPECVLGLITCWLVGPWCVFVCVCVCVYCGP
ncbi:hypothetical protein EJ05DRAFT_150927 [Pseudovirgaria hyperparasitica]|uniref:Uncharacterized protein n=1 Tax=Pseudovirgaria hyperparasitica TaxID=470096 RepID=A0A6A6VWJ5_9PEZI|nr:uncharacterized protein EJ05DRAFT_150927 [Pseudovirgaria hyperparasitica]KAF2754166.1 hypothetical protein EJ05DRAFT_150927 [Pseudovirgaria hyperparasitica]